MCVHIGVGFGVACSDTMAIPEPVKRNSNSAVPLFSIQMMCVCMEAEHYIASDRFFVCLLLSMSNFSFRGQGILRTSRYGEELVIYMVWRK